MCFSKHLDKGLPRGLGLEMELVRQWSSDTTEIVEIYWGKEVNQKQPVTSVLSSKGARDPSAVPAR